MKDFPPLSAVGAKAWANHGIEQEVHDIVAERTADQKLDRDVVDPLRVLAGVGLVGAQPAVRKNVSNRASGGFVALARIGGIGLDDIIELQMPLVERVWRAGEQRRGDGVVLE